MWSKLFLFCVTLVTCTHSFKPRQTSVLVNPSTYYHLIAPGTMQLNSDYPISISLTESESHRMWWFWMILRVRPNETSAYADEMKDHSGTTRLSRFSKSQLFRREGSIFLPHKEATQMMPPLDSYINVENRNYSVYIQTDKAKYKPGEVIQFRLIFLDRFTRPVNVTDDHIFVRFYDGLGNQIKEFSNIVLVQGVHKGYLQISDDPALGEWKIKVKSGRNDLQEKSFQVARFISQTFMVNFLTDENIAFDSDIIVYSVEASYPNGVRVQGNITIQFNTTYSAVGHCHSNYTLSTYFLDTEIGILDLKRVFNFTRNPSEKHPLILYKISAMARVQDYLFGRWSEVKTEITVHNEPYRIKIDVPRSFDPEKLVNISVTVEHIESDRGIAGRCLVKLRIEGIVLANASRPQVATLRFVDVYLVQHSVVASVNLTNDGWMEYKVEAEYDGWISESQTFQKIPDNVFKLDVLTERPEVGKELLVQLRSKDPIDYFVYHILSEFDILQSGSVNVTEDAKTYDLYINATDVMIPKIKLYIHRIKNGVLHSALKEIYIKRVLHNSITIELASAKHGQVAMNVTTDEGSYVGLLAAEEHHLLERNNYRDLTEENIFTALHNFDLLNMDTTKYPGSEAGLLILTNARNAAGSVLGEEIGKPTDQPLPARIIKPTFELPATRDIFCNTWMFEDFKSTPAGGLKMIESMPYTGTWGLTGFSLNPKTGLSFTKEPTIFKVHFDIWMELPNLIKEGEIIEMPIYVTNKMNKDILTNVTVRASGLKVESWDNINSDVVSRTISQRDTSKFVFILRTQAPGVFNVTVEVLSYESSAAKQKTVTVITETMTSYSKRYWKSIVRPYRNGRTKRQCDKKHETKPTTKTKTPGIEDVLLVTPQNAVKDSVTLQLTVVGDVFALFMRWLQEQVRIPIGNCEDTLTYMMANVLILKYMQTMNSSTSTFENTTKLHLEQTYQNLMPFRHSDGSFSLFKRDMPDVWLTTRVLWGLMKARHFIAVEPIIIQQGLNYLHSKLRQGSYFHSGTGSKDDILLTSFALVSCLQNDVCTPPNLSRPTRQFQANREYIKKALSYLHRVQNDVKDNLSVVMSTYAMALAGNASSNDVQNRLRNITNTFRPMKRITPQPDSLQGELETTAKFFITLLDNRTDHTLLPIVKALISIGQDERIPNYLLALEAMIQIAEVTHFRKQNIAVNILDKGGSFRDIFVAEGPQTIRLSPRPGELKLSYRGFGFAIVDLRWNYNILHHDQSALYLKTNITVEEPTTHSIVLKICIATTFQGMKINLSMVEVNLQSGYTFDERSFETAFEDNSQIGSIQFNGHDGSVLVYVKDILDNGTCIHLYGLRTWQVHDARPGTLIVYDSRMQDDKAISFFSITDKKLTSY